MIILGLSSAQTVVAKAGRAIFWKDKAEITSQLEKWRSDALAVAISRANAAERRWMGPSDQGHECVQRRDVSNVPQGSG